MVHPQRTGARDSPDPSATLGELRARIDEVDRSLVTVLVDRFRLVEEVSALKRRDGMTSLDPAREAAIVRSAAVRARDQGLPEEGVRSLFWSVLGLCRQAVSQSAPDTGSTDGTVPFRGGDS